MRHSGSPSRFGESIPDYDEVQVSESSLRSGCSTHLIPLSSPFQDDYSDFVLRDKRMYAKSSEVFKNRLDAKYVQAVLSNSNPNGLSRYDGAMRTGEQQQQRIAQPPANNNNLPWGHVLPPTLEEQLPTYSDILASTGPPRDAVWQTVNGTRFKFFVYSAYYDRRNSRNIRVVGATKTRNPERVWCRLFYPKAAKNGTEDMTVTIIGRVKIIRENWNLKYSACFILCPLKDQHKTLTPYAVSIVAKMRMPPKNLLLVRKSDHDPSLEQLYNNTVANGFTNASTLFAWNENKNTKEFLSAVPDRIAMCVKPLHFNYDQALYLMEFLELNSILGVTHATFYNHTIGRRASCVLGKYMDGTRDAILRRTQPDFVQPMTITILPWLLKMESQKEIRTEGLFAALNDCLYRSMYTYSHVLFIDLDEYVVPHKNRTLTELVRWLSKRPSTGAFSFQNAFFYLQFPDDALVAETADPLQRALLTQRKTQRRRKLHPQKQRSKYIAKPESVIEAGNHFVWEFMPGKGHLNVGADVAILHHYRVCEFGGEDCIKAASMQDRTTHKYSNELVARVRALYMNLKTKCNLPKLPGAPKRATPLKSSGGGTSNSSGQKKAPTKGDENDDDDVSKERRRGPPAKDRNSAKNRSVIIM